MSRLDYYSEENIRFREMIKTLIAKEEEYKRRLREEPIEIEKPQEIDGYEIADVSYRFAYDRNKRLRVEIKDTIYSPIKK